MCGIAESRRQVILLSWVKKNTAKERRNTLGSEGKDIVSKQQTTLCISRVKLNSYFALATDFSQGGNFQVFVFVVLSTVKNKRKNIK